MQLSRHERHEWGRQYVRKMLRKLGFRVLEARTKRYDFVVDGNRVAIRVSGLKRRKHVVSYKGRPYLPYYYRSWQFNFHLDGRLKPRFCDFFICVAYRPMQEPTCYVIPAKKTGPTLTLQCGRRPYVGRYQADEENWNALKSAKHQGNQRRRSAKQPLPKQPKRLPQTASARK